MSGTISGGKLAAQTNKRKHGKDFYSRIGAMGGSVKGTTGGFASLCDCGFKSTPHLKGVCQGSVGGRISKRPKGSKS